MEKVLVKVQKRVFSPTVENVSNVFTPKETSSRSSNKKYFFNQEKSNEIAKSYGK